MSKLTKNPKNAKNAFHVEHLARRVWSGKMRDAAQAKNPKKNLQEKAAAAFHIRQETWIF